MKLLDLVHKSHSSFHLKRLSLAKKPKPLAKPDSGTEICPYQMLSCVMLVFLGYQEICTNKYLQKQNIGCGSYYKETNNHSVCIHCSKDHP